LAALSILTSVSVASGDDAERVARQVINPTGWAIPGREEVVGSNRPTRSATFPLAGKTIHLRIFDLPHRSGENATTIQLMFVRGDSVVIQQHRLIPKLIKEYSLEGVVFCYLVEGAPIVTNGVEARLIELAYYDDDKTGSFKVLEYPNPVVAAGQPVEPIRLPAWAN
jgi:hypothetical protein